MKILILDIETAPNVAYVWGLWKENIPLDRLIQNGYILSWAAKWAGEEEVYFSSLYQQTPKGMLKAVHKLLNQADAVVHYYGSKFDIPTLNMSFVEHGLKPPAPYKQIDLFKTVKKHFKLPSYKLAFIAEKLEVGEKADHGGFETWVGCMNNDPEAWKLMEAYNIQDVLLLEAVYNELKPWIKDHANYSLFEENSLVCPNCGGTRYQRRGYAYTAAAKYRRYQCKDCGNWFRQGRSEAPKPDEKFVNI